VTALQDQTKRADERIRRTRTRRERALEPSGSKDPLVVLGEWGQFMWAAIRETRRLGPLAAEVLRQAGIIATSSTLVIVFVTFLIGGSCGVEASFIGQQIGAGIAAPFFAAVCTIQDIVPLLFGMILAAKVGCGMVAELGAMRVNEEVDAIDVMGISSIAYLVSTRLVAASIVIPPVYLVSVASAQFGAWLTSLVRFHAVSAGTYRVAFFIGLHPIDVVYSTVKGVVIFLVVLATALYYGYRVRGGPVEVGEAAARSMRVNLVLIALMNGVLSLILWGFRVPFPIA
jgi:phospholipid/cholesterol/gamma-HCH transport system permease protein